MTQDEIKQAITQAAKKGGQAVWVSYAGQPSGLNASAKREGRILKRSKLPLQLAKYENRAAVKQAIASGGRETPSLPDWMEYVESVVGGAYFAKHKTSGQAYFCAPRQDLATSAEYLLDGELVDFEAIKGSFTPSALAPRPTKQEANDKGQDLFNIIKLENIQAIS